MRMLPHLQAERQLAAIEASSVPHMTVQGQRDSMGRHARLLRSDERPVRASEQSLAAIGITVEHVDAEGVPVADGTAPDETKGAP